MLYNINMELIQAFNPLYGVPIVAVIFCALLVYTFGFKSPIQPPSFEGFEDKKSSKKRKTKEIQKQNKLITNGKVNGVVTAKGKMQEVSKKKEIADNNIVNDKPKSNEKISTDKKAAKKVKSQNEKQQERKKENVITDELNDDGWVQLVSKKGKKNRKKEDNVVPEIQSNTNQSPAKNIIETNDNKTSKLTSNQVEALNEEKNEIPKEKSLKKSIKKEIASIPDPEKPIKLEIAVEVSPDNYLEQDLKQSSVNIPTNFEETSKSKKKKKKQGTTSVIAESISVNAPVAQIEPVSTVTEVPPALPKTSEPVIDNVTASMPDDSKTNVVFDELAGLYPEAKEKKKKKVRRDH